MKSGVLILSLPVILQAACASRSPTSKELLQALYALRPPTSSPCSRVLVKRIFAASSLSILKSHCVENLCTFEVEVTTPELPEKPLRKAIKHALLEALKGKGEGQSLSERTCNLLSRHLKDLKFETFNRKRFTIQAKRSGKTWKILKLHRPSK